MLSVAALLVHAAMPVTGVRITEGVILQVMGHGMSDLGDLWPSVRYRRFHL